MEDNSKNGSGNQDSSASGDTSGQSQDQQNQKKDFVAYDTHRKLLDEKKKVQEERDRLRLEKEERERKELEAKGEFQKIIELEKRRADEAEAKKNEYEARFAEAKKLSAILKALDNGVDEKFFGFLPTEKIVLDPETGEVNLSSVAEVADMFKKSYPELLKPKNGPKLPVNAPTANGSTVITESEWKKFGAKDKSKWKYHQIIWGS